MSAIKIRPALDALPPELLSFMLPDPAALHGVTVAQNDVNLPQWLPFKRNWDDQLIYNEFSDPRETLKDLRALSHVCRSLRAVALPQLWAVVHVSSVKELGALAEILWEAPYIAPLIRHFSFMWKMNGDVVACQAFPKRHGSLLDMAFIDRGELWDKTRAMHGAKIDLELDEGDGLVYSWFTHNGIVYDEPGEPPEWKDRKNHKFKREEYEEAYARRGPNLHRIGPDGRGEDKRIKAPQDLINCISEVVAQLTSLQAFGWCCRVFPMPEAVFQAVNKLESLTTLHLDMVSRRGSVHSLPFWELTSQVQHLSIRMCHVAEKEEWSERSPQEQVSEADLADLVSFDLPKRIPATRVKILALHEKIASRTIIAAARGGQLRSLDIKEASLQLPFAVPALLPLWVGIVCDAWSGEHPRYLWPDHAWLAARSTLRPALAHVSVWLPCTGSRTSRHDRMLTGEDVGGLAAYYKTRKVPWFVKPEHMVIINHRGYNPLSIKMYLDWLAEDAELAQQVADAWNRVVERGEADVVKCYCKKCQPNKPELTKPDPLKELIRSLGPFCLNDPPTPPESDADEEEDTENAATTLA